MNPCCCHRTTCPIKPIISTHKYPYPHGNNYTACATRATRFLQPQNLAFPVLASASRFVIRAVRDLRSSVLTATLFTYTKAALQAPPDGEPICQNDGECQHR